MLVLSSYLRSPGGERETLERVRKRYGSKRRAKQLGSDVMSKNCQVRRLNFNYKI